MRNLLKLLVLLLTISLMQAPLVLADEETCIPYPYEDKEYQDIQSYEVDESELNGYCNTKIETCDYKECLTAKTNKDK